MSAQAGMELAAKLFAGAPPAGAISGDLAGQTLGHLFGTIWQDDRLSLPERSLVTCTVLVATGREAELRMHLRGARNLGIPRATLDAMILHVAHYAGWPVAVSASRVLNEVWEQMDGEVPR